MTSPPADNLMVSMLAACSCVNNTREYTTEPRQDIAYIDRMCSLFRMCSLIRRASDVLHIYTHTYTHKHPSKPQTCLSRRDAQTFIAS
jgi:hypothetical protein